MVRFNKKLAKPKSSKKNSVTYCGTIIKIMKKQKTILP